jgi:two-component system chemotaxis response regulator CheV
MKTVQQEVDERSNLTGTNKFELLLFRLGGDAHGERNELFGINVFKIREIVAMPEVTAVAGSPPHVLGVVNLRGQIIQVLDLPAITGCVPKTGLNIMLVTEFARTTQAFAVESVEEIVRLDWGQVMSSEHSAGSGMVTSIARLDDESGGAPRLAQVLDVETILQRWAARSSSRRAPSSWPPTIPSSRAR